MEYDLAMKKQDVKSGLHKTAGATETRTCFCSWGLGIFLYSKRANSYFLSRLFFRELFVDIELLLKNKSCLPIFMLF